MYNQLFMQMMHLNAGNRSFFVAYQNIFCEFYTKVSNIVVKHSKLALYWVEVLNFKRVGSSGIKEATYTDHILFERPQALIEILIAIIFFLVCVLNVTTIFSVGSTSNHELTLFQDFLPTPKPALVLSSSPIQAL